MVSIIYVRYCTWLSLEHCCDKELHKIPALKSMFLSHVQGGVVDNGQFFADSGDYLNQFPMSSIVKNIESSLRRPEDFSKLKKYLFFSMVNINTFTMNAILK